jgi:hypothetical protein
LAFCTPSDQTALASWAGCALGFASGTLHGDTIIIIIQHERSIPVDVTSSLRRVLACQELYSPGVDIKNINIQQKDNKEAFSIGTEYHTRYTILVRTKDEAILVVEHCGDLVC